MNNYTKLANRISSNEFSMANYLLDIDKSLDLTFDSGTYFKMSVENNNYDITKTLLDYFEVNQLGDCKENSPEYLLLKSKLQEIITEISENMELSPELQLLLRPYLLNQNSEDNSSQNNSQHINQYDPIDKLDPNTYFSTSTGEDTNWLLGNKGLVTKESDYSDDDYIKET